jgi:hypothetical protein
MTIKVNPGSLAYSIYQQPEVVEEVLCNSGLNPELQYMFDDAGLRLTGFADDGSARIAELPNHRFFVATLYLPQLSSTAAQPATMVIAFLRAALQFSVEVRAKGSTVSPRHPRLFAQAEQEFLKRHGEFGYAGFGPATRAAIESRNQQADSRKDN